MIVKNEPNSNRGIGEAKQDSRLVASKLTGRCRLRGKIAVRVDMGGGRISRCWLVASRSRGHGRRHNLQMNIHTMIQNTHMVFETQTKTKQPTRQNECTKRGGIKSYVLQRSHVLQLDLKLLLLLRGELKLRQDDTLLLLLWRLLKMMMMRRMWMIHGFLVGGDGFFSRLLRTYATAAAAAAARQHDSSLHSRVRDAGDAAR